VAAACVLAKGKSVVVGALYLTAWHGPTPRHVNHVADDGAGCPMQAVAWDRHRRELLPCVRLGVVGLVGAEYLSGRLAAEDDNFAIDVDAGGAAAWSR
jgi:hypothetical protein